MNYYQHHRSNSLLQRAYMLRNNTIALSSNDNPDKTKRDSSTKQVNTNSILESSKNNDSYYDSEAFKNTILSPEEAVNPRYSTPIKTKTIDLSYNTIGGGHSLHRAVTHRARKTLILDLDETLVHSSFRPFPSQADIELQVVFDGVKHRVYVMKRPYVDEFLQKMNEVYDVFVFTASIPQYANPLLDKLDKHRVIRKRLYREHCKGRNGAFVKDLSIVGREMRDMILLDNNPISYNVNQLNGLPILTWHEDKGDTELHKLIPLLEYMATVEDVRRVISRVVSKQRVDYNKVNEMIVGDQLHTPKKEAKADAQITRSLSQNGFNSTNTYENKLNEWTKLKEKMSKNIEEHQSVLKCEVKVKPKNNGKLSEVEKPLQHIIRTNHSPTIVKTPYYTDKQLKYTEERSNCNFKVNYSKDNQLYSNRALNFLQSRPTTLEHSTNFYQTASSFYPNRQLSNEEGTSNDKELKRNISCSCLRTSQDVEDNLIQESSSLLKETPLRATHSEYYQGKEEEEKNFFSKVPYNTNRTLYSSSTSFRRSFNQANEPKSLTSSNDNNANYYSIRKMMMTSKKADTSLIPQDNGRYYDIDNDRASLLANNRRLLFHSSTLGRDFDYNSDEYPLRKREYEGYGMGNTFYYSR